MSDSKHSIPNPTELAILLALAKEDCHGYAIMQDIERRSAGAASLGPGTLYGAIKRMLAAGWVEEVAGASSAPDPRGRRRYHLTRRGRAAASKAARQMAGAVALAAERGLITLNVVAPS